MTEQRVEKFWLDYLTDRVRMLEERLDANGIFTETLAAPSGEQSDVCDCYDDSGDGSSCKNCGHSWLKHNHFRTLGTKVPTIMNDPGYAAQPQYIPTDSEQPTEQELSEETMLIRIHEFLEYVNREEHSAYHIKRWAGDLMIETQLAIEAEIAPPPSTESEQPAQQELSERELWLMGQAWNMAVKQNWGDMYEWLTDWQTFGDLDATTNIRAVEWLAEQAPPPASRDKALADALEYLYNYHCSMNGDEIDKFIHDVLNGVLPPDLVGEDGQ